MAAVMETLEGEIILMGTEANDGGLGVAADSGYRDSGSGGGDAETKRPRADWQMPPASDQRCSACGKQLVPTAVCVYDEGWSLEWSCGNEDCDGWGLDVAQGDDLDWPFGGNDEEPTSPQDLAALGFVVIAI